MARFRLLTPDAQYADDGVIEHETAGGDVDWDIRRAHSRGELSDESLGACDALVTWHEMKIDAAFVSALRRCRIIVRAGVRLRPYRSRGGGHGRYPGLQHTRLRNQRGR